MIGEGKNHYSRRTVSSPTGRRNMREAAIGAKIGQYFPYALLAAACVILLVSLLHPMKWKQARIEVAEQISPALSTLSLPIRTFESWGEELSLLTNIRAENARLRAENDQLKEWYQTALLLRAENQSLKDLLNVLPEAEQTYITSRVVGDSGSSYVKTLLIQAGTENGVEEGQAVMGRHGMIGRIIEAGPRASRVLLLSDINSHIPVIIEGVNQRAILMGNNDDRLTLNHYAPDALIKKGGRVVTSGIGGMFPAGLPIGEIVSIKNGAVNVRMLSDPEGEDYVQIVERPIDQKVKESLESLKFPPPSISNTEASGAATALPSPSISSDPAHPPSKSPAQ